MCEGKNLRLTVDMTEELKYVPRIVMWCQTRKRCEVIWESVELQKEIT
jgi:hypothetical protein